MSMRWNGSRGCERLRSSSSYQASNAGEVEHHVAGELGVRRAEPAAAPAHGHRLPRGGVHGERDARVVHAAARRASAAAPARRRRRRRPRPPRRCPPPARRSSARPAWAPRRAAPACVSTTVASPGRGADPLVGRLPAQGAELTHHHVAQRGASRVDVTRGRLNCHETKLRHIGAEPMSDNSFDARADLEVGGRSYEIYRLDALQQKFDVARLPFCLKVLLENLLRNEDGTSVRKEDIEALAALGPQRRAVQGDRVHARPRGDAGLHRRAGDRRPRGHARRDGRPGRRPAKINPLVPAELVIDHSVQVDAFGSRDAFRINAEQRVRAQRGALRVPALGPGRVRGLRGRAARHRHRPPGQPRVPGPRGVRATTVCCTPTRSSAPTPTPR